VSAVRSGASRRRALVTGAAGFIGASLVRRLASDGWEVVAGVRPQGSSSRLCGVETAVEVAPVDVTNRQATHRVVCEHRPSHVFHLATQRDGAADALVDANVVATDNLLTAAEAAGVERFVFTGSSLEYGAAPTPFHEDAALRPTTRFGVAKAAASLMTSQRATDGRLHTVVLRLFHVYGPREDRSRLVPRALEAALHSTTLALTEPGLCHDFVTVDDVVEALLRAAEADPPPGAIVNVCTGVQTANETLVDAVEHVTGRRVPREPGAFPARSWDRRDWVGDPELAAATLGWRAERGLHQGLAAALQWHSAAS
jgi:nucleoside-diphosphate-sugar epimerase